MPRRLVSLIGTMGVLGATFATAVTAPAHASLPPGPWDPYFTSPTTAHAFGTAGKPYGVAAGDYTGDGKSDLVVGLTTGNTTGLSFAAPTSLTYNSVTGRPFGVVSGDFDRDGTTDLVVARTNTSVGTLAFLKGNGDGTFAAPVAFPWRLEAANAYGLAAGDVNGDGVPDLVFGATVDSCTVAFTAPATCTSAGGTFAVRDGDVRVLYDTYDPQNPSIDTMFAANSFDRPGAATFAAGALMARIAPSGVDVGSVAVKDVDGNGRADVVAGGLDGAGNTVVKLIRSNPDGTFTLDSTSLVSQPTSVTAATTPIIFPAVNPAVSPWGLAFADMNNDGQPDLLVSDRNMYVYVFLNDGTGQFTLQTGFSAASGRPTVFLAFARDALGYTGSLAAGDLNGDGRPDIVISEETGSQTTTSAGANDGNVVAAVSSGRTGYTSAVLGNTGYEARGVNLVDANGDNLLDVVWGTYAGTLSLLVQQPPQPVDPNVYLLTGNGDGTFATPTPYSWRLEGGNTAAFASGDVNGDGKLDLVWGATADGVAGGTAQVSAGDVRVLYGNGDGTFSNLNTYTRLGTTYAAGTLLASIGTAASTVAVGDVDKDGDADVVAGGLAGTNAVVTVLRNDGGGAFTNQGLISETTACTTPCSPVYFPPNAPVTAPWGIALGDVTGDGAPDLFLADRAQYIYRYDNNGSGTFTLHTGNSTVISATRPNVYFLLSASPPVGYTASLAAGDLNGDGKADLAIGLYSGANTPASGLAGDGSVYLALSDGTNHSNAGSVADIGTQARGLVVLDVDGDGAMDVAGGEYGGTVAVLRQLTPKDSDGDGISDYVDNAPYDANAPRLDMNIDGSVNRYDQLDNDGDTVLGDPSDPATWQRLGDPADTDDDNDGVLDTNDNCPLVANADQADRDSDGVGDACDPLDNRDPDGDGVPNSILPGDPLFPAAQAAAAKWASASQHFVIRIDALGRMWQSEFTQTLADAAMAPDEATFQSECTANYANGYNKGTGYLPDCAALQLSGGKNLPVTLATIPKMLWTDPGVVAWINARNDSANLEIAQHGTYHVDNNMNGDWRNLTDRNWAQCETCGFNDPENFEYLKVGQDTLLGNYTNPWIVESNKGVTPTAPKIDWSSSASPLLTYVAPYDTSDTVSRQAMSELGYRGFSASSYEESGALAPFMNPEGSKMYAFDKFGMFHGSAYKQVTPGDVSSLQKVVDAEGGNLHIWLIEEVDWSGRDASDAVNDQIDTAKFAQWNTLLDFVKSYPDSVAMTIGEVALAKAYDNAPTVSNADQADSNHNGVGDVIDGATLTVPTTTLGRNAAGSLTATLKNGAGTPIAGQTVTFSADMNGDGTAENYTGTTNASGVATAAVTPTAPVGTVNVEASWDNGLGTTVTGSGSVNVADGTTVTLASGNPSTGQLTDRVSVSATLSDTDHVGLPGRSVTFSIGTDTATATTDASGVATASVLLSGTAGSRTLKATFTAAGAYAGSSATHAFTVAKETTRLTQVIAVTPAVKPGGGGGGGGSGASWTTLTFRLTDDDATPTNVAGKTITVTYVPKNGRSSVLASAVTSADGVATLRINKSGPMRADFAGDSTYLASTLSFTVA